MDVTLISGDSAGILFRVDPTFSEMYIFEITNRGEASLRGFGTNGFTNILIPARSNPAIYGIGQKNTLLVIAKGNNFQVFVNGAFLGETQDDTLSSGSVGMGVSDYSQPARATFSHLAIYSV